MTACSPGTEGVFAAALRFAAEGKLVFPCDPETKSPLTENGFYNASTDTSQIEKWWTPWPSAMIGMPTGKISGLIAIDIDGEEGLASWSALVAEHDWLESLPETASQDTPSGGKHLLFEWPGFKVKNSTSKLARNIDVRGDGGYIIVAPSRRADGREYRMTCAAKPAQAPQWLLALVSKPLAKRKKPLSIPSEKPGVTTPYGLAALMQEAGKVTVAPEGQRNGALNEAAFALGQLVGGSEVDEGTALAALQRAGRAAGLPDGEIDATARSGFEAGRKEPRTAPEEKEGKQRPCHRGLALKVIESFGAGNLLHDGRSFWQWSQHGVWRKLDDREVKQAAHRSMTATGSVTRSSVDSVLDVARTEAFRPVILSQTQEFVNAANGELHWRECSWEMCAHEREHYSISQAPVVYDPKSVAPRFELFLEEVFAGDQDAAQKRKLLLELIGYSLVPSAVFEKFALLIGPGANGKSIVLHVVQSLLGRENCAAVQPAQFSNRFQRAHLHGKLANIVTELAEGSEIADAELKSIVSGETMTVENKMQAPFDFIPTCTVWLATNHMPHTRDFSDALFRRAAILTFNRTFSEAEQDKHLRQKLDQELPGILTLVLEAFGDVLRQGEFTMPPSVLVAREAWRLEADQVAAFLEDCATRSVGSSIPSQIVYRSYKTWAEEAGIRRTLNQKNFTQRLVRHGFTKSKGAGGVRQVDGIQLTGWMIEPTEAGGWPAPSDKNSGPIVGPK